MRNHLGSWFLGLGLALTGCGDGATTNTDGGTGDGGGNLEALECEVGIVGGGAAGVYAAYRLTPTLGDKVCVFEKEAVVGGRMHDENMMGDARAADRVAFGARRLQEHGHKWLFDFAAELGVELDKPAIPPSDLINARGKFSYSKDDFVPLYPGVKQFNNMDAGNREDDLYLELLKPAIRTQATTFPDFRSFVRSITGVEGWWYLRDLSRFRGDFDYSLAAGNYMEYFAEEWDTYGTPSYPKGGMSAFVYAMEAKVLEKKGHIYTAEPVLHIDREGGAYRLKTSKHSVKVAKLIIAAPPVGFDAVTGVVADDLHKRAEYQALVPIRITVINQWWDTAWWANLRQMGAMNTDPTTWRAWTNEHCVNFIEIPQEKWLKDVKATRSVYNDDLFCANFWEDTLAAGGIAAVEAEVVKGLTYLFNNGGVSTPATVTIPKPKKTVMKTWPGGWYYMRAGTKLTNKQIQDWTVEPIPGEKTLMVVGEAYWGNRAGWSIGAYRSVNKVLQAKFNITPPVEPMELAPAPLENALRAPAPRRRGR